MCNAFGAEPAPIVIASPPHHFLCFFISGKSDNNLYNPFTDIFVPASTEMLADGYHDFRTSYWNLVQYGRWKQRSGGTFRLAYNRPFIVLIEVPVCHDFQSL